MGIHYDSKKGSSVVPYEDNTQKKFDKKVAVSATISIANAYNDDLDLGHTLKAKQALTKGKRAPALFPVMNKSKSSPCLQFYKFIIRFKLTNHWFMHWVLNKHLS